VSGLDVVVTVGMGRWPFDRLLRAVAPLAATHRLFVQRGTSDVPLHCEAPRFVGPTELAERMARADVVVTHAGNTVRLVQRLGKVPLCVAREAARGEMGNDHQVHFLRAEVATGRCRAVWGDLDDLSERVAEHPAAAARLLAERPAPEPVDLTAAWQHLLRELEVEAVLR